jgi:5-hydroxyisourate hydrolase-like protein (transthyretin family)
LDIIVTVIDGVYGRPAEGVGVAISIRPPGGQAERICGRTGEDGEFAYPGLRDGPFNGDNYHLELDVDAYFATLGTASAYRSVAVTFRAIAAGERYNVAASITPFGHTITLIRPALDVAGPR